MKNASFIKRILVMVYDSLLLAGVFLVSYAPFYAIFKWIAEDLMNSSAGKAVRGVYILIICFLFYGWFWTHGGQTLGMKAWRLYLIKPDGKFPGWSTALWRYFLAIASWGLMPGALYLAGVQYWYLSIGLGFTWMLLNRNRLAWHDIFSNTRIVQMPKDSSNNPSNHQKTEKAD